MQFQGIRMYNIYTPQMNTKKAERNSQLPFRGWKGAPFSVCLLERLPSDEERRLLK